MTTTSSYQPPRCVCGHPTGDHKSNQAPLAGTLQFGLCRVCDCRAYQPSQAASAGLWVNADRTVLVRCWEDGEMEVSTRPAPGEVWGPPITVHAEPGLRP